MRRARAFTPQERCDYLRGRRLEQRPVHHFINCQPPFDPEESAFRELIRHGDGVRRCLGWLADEYEIAFAGGRAPEWRKAVCATADLFAGL